MFMFQVSDPSLSITHYPLTIFFRMQRFDDMHVVFRDDTQRNDMWSFMSNHCYQPDILAPTA